MQRLYKIAGSNLIFYITLALFTLGAAWVATASLYPMAFDEEFHYGLLQIYATSWIPYGIEHTRDMAQFGPATGDPSYLFHYLMSFPYRLLDWMNVSDMGIVITLRFINIAFVVASLVLFRKAIIAAGIRPIVANVSLLAYTLVPVLYMLAGQINYDNLLLLIVAAAVLLTVRITNVVRADFKLPALDTTLLAITLLLGMSVKYAFLPIALGIALWGMILIIWSWRHGSVSLLSQLQTIGHGLAKLSRNMKIGLATVGILSVFFAAHYVTNTAQYGHPIPDCAAVFDREACKAYGPWNRNTNYVNSLSPSFKPDSFPVYMATKWIPGMTERLTFSLAGKTNGFQTKQPLPIVLIGFVVLGLIGTVSLATRLLMVRRFSTRPFVWFTLLLCGVYAGVLSLQLYGEYVRTGQPVAINGRYLLLLLPIFAAVLVDAVGYVTRTFPASVKLLIASAIVLLLLIGGAGIGTYIVQSESHWFWPGWGQQSHDVLQTMYQAVVVRWELI